VIGVSGSTAVTNGVIEADLFDAWQYNWKAEPWKTVGKSFDKRTVEYWVKADGSIQTSGQETASPLLVEDAVAKVTLKLAASGAVTVTGEFVAGNDAKNGKYTTVKATGSATLLPTVDEDGETRYVVFVYLAPKGLAPHARCVEVE